VQQHRLHMHIHSVADSVFGTASSVTVDLRHQRWLLHAHTLKLLQPKRCTEIMACANYPLTP
jgi:23S rRNA-/tRNA-specific pseudouridylate synthase